uniref:hypothetical protein n=1 Tax=Rhodococcoides fascians TaxID=1828 RepID=UPI00155D9AAD|nr:hypothetical protein [Rhodococcus fascians]
MRGHCPDARIPRKQLTCPSKHPVDQARKAACAGDISATRSTPDGPKGQLSPCCRRSDQDDRRHDGIKFAQPHESTDRQNRASTREEKPDEQAGFHQEDCGSHEQNHRSTPGSD